MSGNYVNQKNSHLISLEIFINFIIFLLVQIISVQKSRVCENRIKELI